MSITLGSRVKDRITGLSGVVISITHWMHGCTRINIQPEGHKDGKPYESFVIDEPQCEILETATLTPVPRHGERPNIGRADDAGERR